MEDSGWGKGIVKELADWLLARAPDLKGFSASNLCRMKQFYEVYADDPKLAPLVRVLPWTHNLLILGQSKPDTLSPNISASCPSTWRRLTGIASARTKTPASAFYSAAPRTMRSWNTP